MMVEREEGIAHAKERRDGVTDELLSTELVLAARSIKLANMGIIFSGSRVDRGDIFDVIIQRKIIHGIR